MSAPAAIKPRARRWLNLWIGLALLLANALAWLTSGPADLPPEATPRLDPQMAAIWENIRSGQASGQRFEIVVTDQMVTEAVAWFLARHPEVPFSHPQVQIDAQGVTGRGMAYILGVHTGVAGRAWLGVRNDLPQLDLQWVTIGGAAAPPLLLNTVEREVAVQLNTVQNLPVTITRLELQDGKALIEGVYK